MITVVGAGFAGVEAAWAAAQRGQRVTLYEMRPEQTTPAHTTAYFAELVCSNSLKSKSPTSPAGQLKAEMTLLGSVVLETAYEHSVPAGEALGVDRNAFGEAITQKLENHPLIDVRRQTFTPEMAEQALNDPEQILIVATGPLTSPDLAEWLARLTGRTHLYFYDAVSPTVEASTIDRSVAFSQSRYDKGEGDDYINCPFEKDSYCAFVHALIAAERVPLNAFEAGGKRDGESNEGAETFQEKVKYFAGCTPIEAIADKGERSLAFGNFKPVGLTDPRTERRPYAALQLRPENTEKTLYSLVACQNRLRFGEQKRVFRMVPGLEKAEFVRYGVIHRNTYLDAPSVLSPFLQIVGHSKLLVAGQLSGVEGYVESAAMGILTGIHAVSIALGRPLADPPRESAYGGLLAHLRDATPREFAPMNVNWGLFPTPNGTMRDKSLIRQAKLQAANEAFMSYMAKNR